MLRQCFLDINSEYEEILRMEVLNSWLGLETFDWHWFSSTSKSYPIQAFGQSKLQFDLAYDSKEFYDESPNRIY